MQNKGSNATAIGIGLGDPKELLNWFDANFFVCQLWKGKGLKFPSFEWEFCGDTNKD